MHTVKWAPKIMQGLFECVYETRIGDCSALDSCKHEGVLIWMFFSCKRFYEDKTEKA